MKLSQIKYFTEAILDWDDDVDRGMPWQGEKDPYLIWLSEILLQQTRVEQGLPYFVKFKESYPTIIDLANAPDDEVFRMWQGLGYYSRCRNLLVTARHIANNLGGIFPNRHEDILKLKGIGPYTAAAIASFAYGINAPVVDGNVKRVISRYAGMELPVDGKEGIIHITDFSQKAIDCIRNPAQYNQAIMNFGAIHCTPKKPKCRTCPVHSDCYAFGRDLVNVLPRKEKKIKKKSRYFIYLHLEVDDQLLIQQRTAKDVWQQLYQLPLIEVAEKEFSEFKLSNSSMPIDFKMKELSPQGRFTGYKQLLTHQRIHANYLKFSMTSQIEIADKSYLWVSKSQLDSFAFPKVVLDYLKVSDLQRQLPF
jgi:A/G-specific adenine glycosylase